MVRHVPRSLRFVVLGLCLLSIPLAAEESRPVKPPLAQTSITPTRVEWLPLAEHKSLTLTVAGPDGFYLERDLRAGETPSFSALDFQDSRLPDGVYAYELRTEGTAAQSGHLWVQEGRFVDKLPADVKPPIRNITALEEVIPEDLVVQGHACIGGECEPGDASDTPPLKIKGEFANHQIVFDGSCCYPTEHDWAIQVGDPGPSGDFLIRDLLVGTTPFRIGTSAPDNAFTILYNGDVGVGTSTPAEKLHVLENADANTILTVENPSTGLSAAGAVRAKSDSAIVNFQAHGSGRTLSRFGQTLASWAEFLQVTGNGFILGTFADKPLILGTNSTNRIHITGSGNVGIGTTSPSTPLHVSRSDGTASVLIKETSGTAATRTLLQLSNNGASRLNFEDSSALATWGLNNTVGNLNMIKSGTGLTAFVLQGNGNLTIAGTLTQGSDRDTKTEIVPVHPEEVLAKLVSLPISTWSRKDEDPKVRHLGPMAQDFSAIFGLGEDNRHIAPLDMAGVSMASIQALDGKVTRAMAEKDAEIAMLRQRLAALEELVSKLAPKDEPAP